jgi:hypothetical protein
MPLALAAGATFASYACSNTNFGGGAGKLSGKDKSATGNNDAGDTGGATAGNPVPWSTVQQACADDIKQDCSGKTSQNDIDQCLGTAAQSKAGVSSACNTALKNFNAGSNDGNGGGSGGADGKDGLANDSGQSGGTTSGVAGDGGGTLGLADLVLSYSTYLDGDGSNDTTAQSMQITILGPDGNGGMKPLTGTIPAFSPTLTDSGNGAIGSVTFKGACKCGATTTFQLKWHATGSSGAFDGAFDTDDAGMWLSSHNAPGKGHSNTHWSDDPSVGSGPSGQNMMYMSEDHPYGVGLGWATPCSVPYFYCGSKDHDHPWDYMDDIQLRFECKADACSGSLPVIDFMGSSTHNFDPN